MTGRVFGLLALTWLGCGGARVPASEAKSQERVIAIGVASPEVEREIRAAIDASNAAEVALWQRVVEINSGTSNLEGVRQVGAVFKGGRGWHAPGETADLSRLPVATKRAALLIYRLTRPGIP